MRYRSHSPLTPTPNPPLTLPSPSPSPSPHHPTEQKLCEAEGIPAVEVAFRDNAPTIAALHARPRGVLPLTDEECRTPKGSDSALAKKVMTQLQALGHEQGHIAVANEVSAQEGRAAHHSHPHNVPATSHYHTSYNHTINHQPPLTH